MADSFVPEPDLHPLYPTPLYLDPLLAANSGLSPPQKHDLVQHSLLRACTFADLTLLSYLLSDSLPCSYVDLAVRDEDGLGLISTTILGFGGDSDRDLDREECVRLLVTEGADLHTADNGEHSSHHFVLSVPGTDSPAPHSRLVTAPPCRPPLTPYPRLLPPQAWCFHSCAYTSRPNTA